jgi:hypothetical protein
LGLESRREKRRRGTGEGFADPRRGQCLCIYAVSKNKLYYAESRKVRGVKRGAIEEGKYEGKAGDMPHGSMYER